MAWGGIGGSTSMGAARAAAGLGAVARAGKLDTTAGAAADCTGAAAGGTGTIVTTGATGVGPGGFHHHHAAAFAHAQNRGNLGQEQRRVLDARQRDQERALRKEVLRFSSDRQGQPRLAHAAGPGQG